MKLYIKLFVRDKIARSCCSDENNNQILGVRMCVIHIEWDINRVKIHLSDINYVVRICFVMTKDEIPH